MSKYDRKDRLYQKAKTEGYRSRAAYKLLELDEKFKIFRPGMKVLDLGSFPGGWMQVAAERTGARGRVVGIDLKDIAPFRKSDFPGCERPNEPAPVDVFKGDVFSSDSEKLLKESVNGLFDVVLSDLSPALTGIKFGDAARAAELVSCAAHMGTRMLKKNGIFVCKAFPSNDMEEVVQGLCKKFFLKMKRVVLSSTRDTSNEFYLVCWGIRQAEERDDVSQFSEEIFENTPETPFLAEPTAQF